MVHTFTLAISPESLRRVQKGNRIESVAFTGLDGTCIKSVLRRAGSPRGAEVSLVPKQRTFAPRARRAGEWVIYVVYLAGGRHRRRKSRQKRRAEAGSASRGRSGEPAHRVLAS